MAPRDLRKMDDVWAAVEDKRRAAAVTAKVWRRSFEGVQAALLFVGLTLVTPKPEFDALYIPVYDGRHKHYFRKVVVKRGAETSEATMIQSLLTGNSKLLTAAEFTTVRDKIGSTHQLNQPKRSSSNNDAESSAADELDMLVNTDSILSRVHLTEFRLVDVAYCLKEEDVKGRVFLGDQVKSARADRREGRCQYNHHQGLLNIGGMVDILEAGMSLTCIGKTVEDVVDVVWFFHGVKALQVLKDFSEAQGFSPCLHPKNFSQHPFTLAYSAPEFRFDVGKSKAECERLLARKVEAVKTGVKHSLSSFSTRTTAKSPGGLIVSNSSRSLRSVMLVHESVQQSRGFTRTPTAPSTSE